MPIADTPMPPPRRSAGAASTPTGRGPGRPPKKSADDIRLERYTETAGSIKDISAGILMMVGLDADAGAVHLHGQAAVPAAAQLGVELEPVGQFFDMFDKVGGKYVEIAFAFAPLLMQLAANHGWYRGAFGGMFNTQHPELLRAQVVADKMRRQQEAQAALAAAQEEAERLLAEARGEVPAA